MNEHIHTDLLIGETQRAYDRMAAAMVTETWCVVRAHAPVSAGTYARVLHRCIPEQSRPAEVRIPSDFGARLQSYRALRAGRARHEACARRAHTNVSRVCERLAKRAVETSEEMRGLREQLQRERADWTNTRMRIEHEHARETSGLRTELAGERLKLERLASSVPQDRHADGLVRWGAMFQPPPGGPFATHQPHPDHLRPIHLDTSPRRDEGHHQHRSQWPAQTRGYRGPPVCLSAPQPVDEPVHMSAGFDGPNVASV